MEHYVDCKEWKIVVRSEIIPIHGVSTRAIPKPHILLMQFFITLRVSGWIFILHTPQLPAFLQVPYNFRTNIPKTGYSHQCRFSHIKGPFSSCHSHIYEKYQQNYWRWRCTLTYSMASVHKIWVQWNYLGFNHCIVCSTLPLFCWWTHQSWIC